MNTILETLARRWWVVLLRGIVAMVFGIMALFLPTATLAALVMFLGAFMLIDGMFAAAFAIWNRSHFSAWWLMLLEGLSGVLLGLIALFWPGLTAVLLILLAAFWILLASVLRIVLAFRWRAMIENEWRWILGGVIGIVFGALLIAYPGAGLVWLAWMLGLFALFFGGAMVAFAFRLKGLRDELEDRD